VPAAQAAQHAAFKQRASEAPASDARMHL